MNERHHRFSVYSGMLGERSSRQIHQRRHDVDHLHRFVDDRPGGNPIRSEEDQRHFGRRIPAFSPVAQVVVLAEIFTVVRGDDEDRAIENPRFFQEVE